MLMLNKNSETWKYLYCLAHLSQEKELKGKFFPGKLVISMSQLGTFYVLNEKIILN